MSLTLGGTNPAVTFPDGTVQNTSANLTAPYTANGVVYASSTSALATGSGLVFDGSNLGLGVTPSAWYSGFKVVEIGSKGGALAGASGEVDLFNNAYNNGSNYIYGISSYATQFQMNNLGQFRWYTAPSGTAGGAITFTQAMTLDNSGNLLVGTTSNSVSSGAGIKLLPANDGANKPVLAITTSASDSSSSALQYYSTGASAYRFYVNAAGTIFATSTSITAISDESLKTNIKPLETGLAQVLALQPRRFDWINGDALNVAGFIAQEVEQVLPDLVSDFMYDEGITKKSVKMGDMLPTIVKAMQEMYAEIQSLKAEVATLKGA